MDFLSPILAAPEDDGPRLVYADWLQERADPRGEFIVASCELARVDPTEPGTHLRYDMHRATLCTRQPSGVAAPLWQRASALLAKHQLKWVPSQYSGVRFGYHRGFVYRVALDGRAFEHLADALFATEPVRWLHFGAMDVIRAKSVFFSPHLRRIHRLSFTHAKLNHTVLTFLSTTPHLEGLRYLDLFGADLTLPMVEVLAKTRNLPSLEVLDLRACHKAQEQAAGLQASFGDRLRLY